MDLIKRIQSLRQEFQNHHLSKAVLQGITTRRLLLLSVLALLVLIAFVIYYIVLIDRRVLMEGEEQRASTRAHVDISTLRAPSTDGLLLHSNPSHVRAVALFEGTRYVATSGGLAVIDDRGSVTRRYTTLDGLPDNDLTTLATFRDNLYIGTGSAGLIAFDGRSFTGFKFVQPKASRVSVLLAGDTELLIGTLDGGLFEFDGVQFTRRHAAGFSGEFDRVTALLEVDARLYIGTQDRGLFVCREAQIDRIGVAEGLPSPHVTSLVRLPSGSLSGERIAVATDFGVVSLNDSNEIELLSPRPNVSSLAVSSGRLWAGLYTGGVIDLGKERGSRSGPAAGSVANMGLPQSSPSKVWASEGTLWALTGQGLFAREEGSSRLSFQPVAASLVHNVRPSGDHVTGLAFDGAGRLWVGYFDRGIDIFSLEAGEMISHLEDDRVREVNFIAFDRGQDSMLAATSRGVVVFNPGLRASVLTREQDGVASNSVAHVLPAGRGYQSASGAMDGRETALVLATGGGLTEISSGRARSLTAFHGLASNHLYTSATVGSKLFVGSLAGLVELDGLRVVRTYNTSNSSLSHNWVTALADAYGTLYVGTNGGGVDALLPSGEWVSFAGEISRFEVNQNAMHFDGERLYVGTSDRGLLIYNTGARRWTTLSAGLPSQSVTAITSDEEFIYAGTLNGFIRIERRVIDSRI